MLRCRDAGAHISVCVHELPSSLGLGDGVRAGSCQKAVLKRLKRLHTKAPVPQASAASATHCSPSMRSASHHSQSQYCFVAVVGPFVQLLPSLPDSPTEFKICKLGRTCRPICSACKLTCGCHTRFQMRMCIHCADSDAQGAYASRCSEIKADEHNTARDTCA